MKTTTDFKEFMSYVDWNELDINEKRALLDAANSPTGIDLGLFRAILIDKLEDKTRVEYPLGDISLIIDLNSRRDFIRYIEHIYMHDEDFSSYLSWLEAVEEGENPHAIISSLPTEQFIYLKNINLENTFLSCRVIYGRKPSDSYKIKPLKKTKNDQLFYGYSENEYPSDELDRAIRKELEKKFANLFCQTSFVMFDAEIRNIKQWSQQMKKETLNVRIEFIPIPFSSVIQPQIYNTEIDVLFYPIPEEKQQRLRTDIVITTDDIKMFSHLKDLLEKTYVPFSEIIK